MPTAIDQDYDALIARAQEAQSAQKTQRVSQVEARSLLKGLTKYREFERVGAVAQGSRAQGGNIHGS